MSTAATIAASAVVAGIGALVVPELIARLPEPASEPAPEAGAEEETPLDRMLREEGPKIAYVDLARAGWVRPLAVALSVVSALAIAAAVEPARLLVGLVPLLPVLAALAIIDARTRLLPKVIVLPALAVGVVLVVVEAVVAGHCGSLVRALLGALAMWLLFAVLWFIRSAGMGFGDVRLAALIGLVLGRIGWGAWVLGLYAGLLCFTLFAIGLVAWHRDLKILKRAYPYGPAMILGAVVAMVVG